MVEAHDRAPFHPGLHTLSFTPKPSGILQAEPVRDDRDRGDEASDMVAMASRDCLSSASWVSRWICAKAVLHLGQFFHFS